MLRAECRFIDPDQWHAYQIRAFGSLLGELDLRIEALRRADEPDATKVADKLATCCRTPQVITVDDGRRYYLAESRCKSRVCPRCSRIRARQLATRIIGLVRFMDAPRFLTLTIRSNDQPLRDQVKHLRRRFAALRRTKPWLRHVRSGVYTIEITYNPATERWHPHLHAIIDGLWWAQSDLLRSWQATVGDQAGVDIRAVHGVRKLANYLACYVAKSCDLGKLSPPQLAEWAVETHGLRLAQTFGRIHRHKPQTDDPEPLAIRVVEIDVNELAYCAMRGCPDPELLLRLLEPRSRNASIPSDGQILGLIAKCNNPTGRAPPAPKRSPRDQIPIDWTAGNTGATRGTRGYHASTPS